MIDGRVYKWKDPNYPEPLVMLGWNFKTIMFAQFYYTGRTSVICWPVITPKQLREDLVEVGRIADYPDMMKRLELSIRPYQSVDKG